MKYAHAHRMYNAHQAVLGRRLLSDPDAPFEDGALVVDSRDGSLAVVNSQTFRSAVRARLDEPGEPEGWDVEVAYGDGARAEVDAEYLTVLDEEDA